jgi:hypothetical protein
MISSYKRWFMVCCVLVATETIADAKSKAPPKSKDITLSLDCKTITSAPVTSAFPQQIAALSADDAKATFVITGGGCEASRATTNRFFISRPTEDAKGWFCQAGDFPGTREDSTIIAFARACRVSSK